MTASQKFLLAFIVFVFLAMLCLAAYQIVILGAGASGGLFALGAL